MNTLNQSASFGDANTNDANTIEWFFDFISPYAYIQHKQLQKRDADLNVVYRPVLFAGLLKHWGHLGPAEIPLKREMTYQYCHWYAEKENIPYKTPPAHPFNPLPWLRLCISQSNEPSLLGDIFDTIWGKGLDPTDPMVWQTVCEKNDIDNASEHIALPWVKQTLKDNTDRAIALGLFGVPTILAKGKLFWGCDMTEMAFVHMVDSDTFETDEYRRLATLPHAPGLQRK